MRERIEGEEEGEGRVGRRVVRRRGWQEEGSKGQR